MASDLLSIASSGAQAARIALDVTAQNIANAVDGRLCPAHGAAAGSRRGRRLRRGSATSRCPASRLDRVVRNADLFRQAEVRRTGADAARAERRTRRAGKHRSRDRTIERLSPRSCAFEGALQQLAADPVDPVAARRCDRGGADHGAHVQPRLDRARRRRRTPCASRPPTASPRSTCSPANSPASTCGWPAPPTHQRPVRPARPARHACCSG